jgi:hypothetical protein
MLLKYAYAALALAGLAVAKVSPDGSCGGKKGYTCAGSAFGNCCSKYNYWFVVPSSNE